MPRIFMFLGGMKAPFVLFHSRDLGVHGSSIVQMCLSCLVDLNSDLHRLCCSLHGLARYFRTLHSGLGCWIDELQESQQQQPTLKLDDNFFLGLNPHSERANYFFVLARQVQQDCTQVVCSNKVAWKRLAPRHSHNLCVCCFVLLTRGWGRLEVSHVCMEWMANTHVLLCFFNPRVRKIRNEASSCPGIFSRTLRLKWRLLLLLLIQEIM